MGLSEPKCSWQPRLTKLLLVCPNLDLIRARCSLFSLLTLHERLGACRSLTSSSEHWVCTKPLRCQLDPALQPRSCHSICVPSNAAQPASTNVGCQCWPALGVARHCSAASHQQPAASGCGGTRLARLRLRPGGRRRAAAAGRPCGQQLGVQQQLQARGLAGS